MTIGSRPPALSRVSSCFIFCFCLHFAATGLNSRPLAESFTALEQWVETERLISREQQEWGIQKMSIQDLIRIYRDELELLEEQYTQAREATTLAETRRAELRQAEDELLAVARRVETHLATNETEIRQLIRFLPQPLRQELQPLIQRLPRQGESTSQSLSVRLQTIVGILSQVDRFNTSVTVVPEIRDFGEQRLIEVRSIYFGLAGAFYADASGSHGGIGFPAAEQWSWQERDAFAPEIRNLIQMYAGETTSIRFVSLPAEIRDLFNTLSRQ